MTHLDDASECLKEQIHSIKYKYHQNRPKTVVNKI